MAPTTTWSLNVADHLRGSMHTSGIWSGIGNGLQNALGFLLNCLTTGISWTGHLIWSGTVALYQFLHIADALNCIGQLLLGILKWYTIFLVAFIAIPPTARLLQFGLRELLEVYDEHREQRLRRQQAIERLHEERMEEASREAERQEEERREEQRREEQRLQEAIRAAMRAKREAEEREARRQDQERKARLQKEQAEQAAQAMREKLKKRDETRIQDAKAAFAQWDKACATAFHDRTTMDRLPIPVLRRCTEPYCPELAKSPAVSCKHNLRLFFREAGKLSLEDVKRHRNWWHPDKFGGCKELLRAEFTRQANMMFIAINGLYEELNNKKT